MKKLIILISLFSACNMAMAQKSDTVKYKPVQPPYRPAPNKIYQITLNISLDDFGLFMFSLSSAPIMQTDIPANQVQGLNNRLKAWMEMAEAQRKQQNFTDSTALAKPKK